MSSGAATAAASSASVRKPIVAYDALHYLHAGPTSSAERPDRVTTIAAHLQCTMPNSIEWHVLNDPVPSMKWDPATNLNCSACTFVVAGGSAVCSMCDSMIERQWNYVNDRDGDTTYQTPYTTAIVHRAELFIRAEMEALCKLDGQPALTFAMTRPPGHHACEGRRTGFCHRNFAIDALDVAHHLGKKAVILDIDAHHGDGTEEEVLKRTYGHYVSLHAYGDNIYPGTGHDSSDRCLNIPLNRSVGDDEWSAALLGTAIPWMKSVGFDVIILSCGFDAHADDEMVPLRISEKSFQCCSMALRGMACPLLAILEGGYHAPVLGPSVDAIIRPFTL